MSEPEIAMVAVPRELLTTVLDQAESDSFSTEAEFACSEAECKRYADDRTRIDELRKIAGVTSEGVVGQGFFGIANALKEHKDKADK